MRNSAKPVSSHVSKHCGWLVRCGAKQWALNGDDIRNIIIRIAEHAGLCGGDLSKSWRHTFGRLLAGRQRRSADPAAHAGPTSDRPFPRVGMTSGTRIRDPKLKVVDRPGMRLWLVRSNSSPKCPLVNSMPQQSPLSQVKSNGDGGKTSAVLPSNWRQ